MDDDSTAEEVSAFVLAYIQGAAQALRNQDIGCLTAAVALYEEHLSSVYAPPGQLCELLGLYPRCTQH